MTIAEAIGQADALYFNTFSNGEKTAWLSRLDGMVRDQILAVHEGSGGLTFSGYGPGTDPATVLLVPPPYDGLYLPWLQSQMELALRETEGYNASILTFNALYEAFEKYWNRTHMPLSRGSRFRF